MKNQNILIAYILIGSGIYFLIKQLNFSFFANFHLWSTFLIIVGISFIIYSFKINELDHIFIGVLLLGLGVHFHGLENYSFWFDHWAVFILIIGLAFLIRFFYTKKGFLQALIFLGVAILIMFSINLPRSFQWIYRIIEFLETFWPVALIVIGIYLLKFRHRKSR